MIDGASAGRCDAVVLDPAVPIIADLISNLPRIRRKLRWPRAWRAYRLSDPAERFSYLRLICREDLCLEGDSRRYLVGIHRFEDRPGRSAMHDHRFPFAVYPFGLSTGDVVYEMPWRSLATSPPREGAMEVYSGRPYAILDHRRVQHAVVSCAGHYSVVIADRSVEPHRGDRLDAEELPRRMASRLRRDAARQLKRTLDSEA